MRGGKQVCRRAQAPPQLHGPYHQWTRKIDGKTAAVNLTDHQVARYGSWFTNAQTLRSLLIELEDLSLRIAGRTEGWG